jgi:hypothetical protein
MTHVFASNVGLLQAADKALDEIGDFLNRQLLEDPESVAAIMHDGTKAQFN